MALLGYHGSIKKSCYSNSVRWHCEKSTVSCPQIVMKSPYQWRLSRLNEDDCIYCKNYVVDNNIFLVSHGSYLINMATECDAHGKEINNAVDDLRAIHRVGGIGSVFHVGKHKKRNIVECLDNMETFIQEVIRQTIDIPTHFILETAAGQGTELCVTMEELATFYNRFTEEERKKVRLCVDTCHIFAAGYDLTTPEKTQEYISLFDTLIGWKYVDLIHLNDSKQPCASKKDRHENIGEGYITNKGENKEGLAVFVYEMDRRNIPMILETPCGTLSKPAELTLVKELIQMGAELTT